MFPAWICIAILWLTYGTFKQSNMVAGKAAIIEITKYQEIENDVCFLLWNEGFCWTERHELLSRQIASFMPWNPKNMAALKKERNKQIPPVWHTRMRENIPSKSSIPFLRAMQYFILFTVETLHSLLPYQDHLYILEVRKIQILMWVLWS